MTRFNLACFVINVYSPEEDMPTSVYPFGEEDKRVLSNLPAMLEATEENLQDLLPPGYLVAIREWSDDG